MSARDFLLQWLNAKHGDLVAGYRRSTNYPSSVIGQERELLIHEFLEQTLPNSMRFGSGVLIDAAGRATGQQDIVLELPSSISFPITSGNQRLYLAQTVAAAIEVKSNLNYKLQHAIEQTDSVTRLWAGAGPSTLHTTNYPVARRSVKVPAYIVGYHGPKLDRLLNHHLFKLCQQKRKRYYPQGILCLEPAYFWGTLPDATHVEAEGPAGSLFAFLMNLSTWISANANETVDLWRYVQLLTLDQGGREPA